MRAFSPALFRAFPGTLLTAGSDAHATGEVGRAVVAIPTPQCVTASSVIEGLRGGPSQWGRWHDARSRWEGVSFRQYGRPGEERDDGR